MKKILISIFIFIFNTYTNAQIIKVAILDFENVSGIAKYDGLGKAMSSMLITDIEANVSPKRLQLVERSQIQKILKEQNFQASAAVDKNSTVKAGKILGVKYLLLGDIYVLNDALIINARFVDSETGDIKFSKKQEGKLPAWLSLKTNIAKELATSISMPFSEPAIKDIETPIATITTFGNAITAKDTGNIQMAEKLAETVQEFSPGFKYIEDLKAEILSIKERLERVEQEIENTTENPVSVAENFVKMGDIKKAEKYYLIELNRLKKTELGRYIYYNLVLAEVFSNNKDYEKTIYYCKKIFEIYPYYDDAILLCSNAFLQLNRRLDFLDLAKLFLSNVNNLNKSSFFESFLESYKRKSLIEGELKDLTINKSSESFSITIQGRNSLNSETSFIGEEYGFELGSNQAILYTIQNFHKINNALFGLDSTISFLKVLSSKFNMKEHANTMDKQYHYVTETHHEAELMDSLILIETGEYFKGYFFELENGTIWNAWRSFDCPCQRLVTPLGQELEKTQIKTPLQNMCHGYMGWYSLLNKDIEAARAIYLNKIKYDLINPLLTLFPAYIKPKDSTDHIIYNNFLTSLRQDSEDLLKNIFNSKIYIKSADLNNDIINYAHTYTIENKISEAKRLYLSLDLNHFMEEFGKSVKDVIINDLKEFLSKKLISQKSYDELIISL